MKFQSGILFLWLVYSSFAQLGAESYLGQLKSDSGPIDIVYIWDNFDDPTWLKAIQTALTNAHSSKLIEVESKRANQKLASLLLKYSLRSIHQFAPFVNHIYIVTSSQPPQWLKAHPKVTLVNHRAIFKKVDDLPTFNVQAIEANLHHIPHLSERFIYFQPQFFLGSTVEELDFFTKDGKMKFSFAKWVTPLASADTSGNKIETAWKHTNRFLDSLYTHKTRKSLKRSPYALRKSLLLQLERTFLPLFAKVSSHTFETSRDYVMINGVVQYIACNEGHAKPMKRSNRTIYFGDDVEVNRKRLCDLNERRPPTFAIHDARSTVLASGSSQLDQFLSEYFPTDAPWEK